LERAWESVEILSDEIPLIDAMETESVDKLLVVA
jgi:hypothetical protein